MPAFCKQKYLCASELAYPGLLKRRIGAQYLQSWKKLRIRRRKAEWLGAWQEGEPQLFKER
jgi:hypothetical protein